MKPFWSRFGLVLIVIVFVLSCTSDTDKKVSHFEKGVGYFDKGEYKAAEIEFKNAIQIDPKYDRFSGG